MTSLYELTDSWEKPARLRIVENFSGDVLDTNRWLYTLLNGTATGTISNSVDGGFNHTSTATGGTSESITTLNDIRQFNNLGSSFICVAKWAGTFGGNRIMQRGGFKYENSDTFNNGQLAAFSKPTTGNFDIMCASTGQSPATAGVDTGVDGQGTDWNSFKGDLKPASFDLSINGVLRATMADSAYLPTVQLQPFIYSWGYQPTAGSMTASFNYYEAWNH